MIVGIFHQGSGLGNQLHRYVATRVKADELGVPWGMIYREDGSGKERGFKGDSFMNIGNWQVDESEISNYSFWREKEVRDENGYDIRSYDPEFNFISNNTIIDGEFQDSRYFEHKFDRLSDWLSVKSLELSNDFCAIGFRGGEYALFPDLFLTNDYWEAALSIIRGFNSDANFEVQTDDYTLARAYFPSFSCLSDVELNWRKMRFARYAIIANSSFFILPRLLKHYEDETAVTIAPRFWARRNRGIWCLPQNYYKQFIYV